MKTPPLVMLLALALISSACQTQPQAHEPSKFTKLRVTDLRGQFVSEWIAEGPVQKVELGYRVKAVERISGPPHSMVTHYPDGWRTTVAGPHILKWQCGEPFWLYEMREY